MKSIQEITMRHRLAGTAALAAVFVLAAASAAFAQGSGASASSSSTPRGSGDIQMHFTKNPDISGIWTHHPDPSARKYASCCFADPKITNSLLTPWGLAKFHQNRPGFGPDAVSLNENDPTIKCEPPGVPRIYMHLFPIQIVQLPGMVLELFEYDHFVRRIYTDGRGHPKDLDATWMGNSIGHWEGDTLVVDTVGLNDKTWIDRDGHPHSDKEHVIERIRRAGPDTLKVGITVDDPVAYTKPVVGEMTFEKRPDWNIEEHICEDNVNDTDLEQ
jgi:hypothetical protein